MPCVTWDATSTMSDALTPAEESQLLAAAVTGVAWALIDSEVDVCDRGVSSGHYQDALRRAREILPNLIREPLSP